MELHPLAKRFFVLFLRYSPTLGVLAFTIHYALLPHGVRTIMPDYIFDLSFLAYLFLMTTSYTFGFCPLHRAFITYIAIGSLDVDLHHWVSLGLLPAPVMPTIMFLAGVSLFAILIHRETSKKRQ